MADENSSSSPTRRTLLQVGALVGAGIATSLFLRSRLPVGEDVGDRQMVGQIRADKGSPTLQVTGADVTIISFNDFGCSACRSAHPALMRAVAEDGRTQIVYKDWPIFGPRSERAARIALAADYQGIYPAVYDALMTGLGLGEDDLQAAVESAGGNWRQTLGDLEARGPAITAMLNRHRLQAFSLGLQGTPAFLIGPILVRGAVSEGAFLRAIERAREAEAG